MQSNQLPILIDVREKEEFSISHLHGAVTETSLDQEGGLGVGPRRASGVAADDVAADDGPHANATAGYHHDTVATAAIGDPYLTIRS